MRSWAFYILTARCGMSVRDAIRKMALCELASCSYERLVDVELSRCGLSVAHT